MAPFPKSLKLDHHDILISDFEENYTQACFFSSSNRHVRSTVTNFCIRGRDVRLKIDIFLTPGEGLVEVTLRRCTQDREELFPICLGGKVRLLDSDSSSSFEATKFCDFLSFRNSPNSSCCACTYPSYEGKCKYGGSQDFTRQYLEVGNDIPEQATIRLELELFPLNYEPEHIPDDNISYLKQDMAALRKNPALADVKLICDGKYFMAHKAVLAARSDVFAALFRHKGTKEDESDEVHIEDCNHKTMEIFLSHVYEDAVPPQDVSFEVAKQLMNVANKYNVPSLMKMGGRILLACLNEKNAFQMAVLGRLYNMDALKKAAKKVIASSEMSLIDMVEESGLRLQDGGD